MSEPTGYHNWKPYEPPQAAEWAAMEVSGTPYAAPMKHSGLGITSFVLAILVGVGEVVMVGAAGVMASQQAGGVDENSPVAIGLGLAMIGGLLAAVIGGGLGFASLFQRDRQKVFGILGMVFNGLILLGVVGLIGVGLMVGD